jgi:hypothetical protein
MNGIKVGDIVRKKKNKEILVYSGMFRPNVDGLGGHDYCCYTFQNEFQRKWLPENDFEIILERFDEPTFIVGDKVYLRSVLTSNFTITHIGKGENNLVIVDVSFLITKSGMIYQKPEYNLPALMFDYRTKLS